MVKKVLSVNGKFKGVAGSRGSSVKGILFFLFALAVCFGYFYFFTDVLRPKEETPGQPDVYTSEMKKPLPERLVQSAATSAEQAGLPAPSANALSEQPLPEAASTNLKPAPEGATSGEKIVKTPPVAEKTLKPLQPTAKTAAKKVGEDGKKTVKAVVKPASAPVAPKTSAAKPAASKVAASAKGVKKVVAGPDAASPAKTATETKTATAKKSTASEKPAASKSSSGLYTLSVGTYVLKSSVIADKLKLEKAGLQVSVSPGKVKTETMNRLLVAEVPSSSEAREELARVKKTSKDAFLLRNNGTYAIYAGSYFNRDRALQEQERLRKEGFAPILKQSQAPVSMYSLTAGKFPTREAALKEAERLKKMGFKPYPALLQK